MAAISKIELYCTYFDHNYLRKGLILYLSLIQKTRPLRAALAVLALSEKCEVILRKLALPDLIIIPLNHLEKKHPQLLSAKANRSLVEYYFTLTPWVIKEALSIVPDARRATYLDSDLIFLSSPTPLWEEIGNSPISMVEHRFSPEYKDKITYGRFNVSWNSFDRSPEGADALEWWANSCLEWCFDRVDGEKFADQGYLTTMERKYNHVHILRYPGINLAEYNLDNYKIDNIEGTITANHLPVIYWHMHSLIEKSDGQFSVAIRGDLLENPHIKLVYSEYIQKLRQLNKRLENRGFTIDRGSARYS